MSYRLYNDHASTNHPASFSSFARDPFSSRFEESLDDLNGPNSQQYPDIAHGQGSSRPGEQLHGAIEEHDQHRGSNISDHGEDP
jgi:hypothetical protein